MRTHDKPQAATVLPKLFSMREAAEALHLSYTYVQRQVSTGQYRGVKFGRRWFLTADELQRVIALGQQVGAIEANRPARP